ncbi:MAG: FxsA family protein [Acidiferrobacterales bacterium]
MGIILVAVFLLVPLVEVWLLITVGGVIGVGWTIFFIILTAVLGAFLVRAQGMSTLVRSQAMLDRGELPALELLEGVALLIAGALLLTPGFFTDAVGFTLLIPTLRRSMIRRWVLRALNWRISRSPRRGPPGDDQGRTLEGDFRRVDD